MNVLPFAGLARQPDLAAEQPRDLAADRQARGRCRRTCGSSSRPACWNASKMIRCLSAGMPMPVSVTRNATTLPRAVERSVVGSSSPSVAMSTVEVDRGPAR